MKILMICHFLPYPPHGGNLQRSFNLLREISRNNKIHLLALNQKAILPDEESINRGIEALSEFCEEIKVYAIPLDLSKFKWYLNLFLNLFSPLPFTVRWFKSGELRNEIEKQIRSCQFDLIHFDTIDLFQYSGIIPDIPRVLNHHNVESTLLLRRGANEKNIFTKFYLNLQGRKLKRYEKYAVGKVNVNITVSESDSETLRKAEPRGKFKVVPNGTDINYFTPAQKGDSKELVYIGGMNWYPNRDAMIYFYTSIYPIIKMEIPDVIMNIIGQDPPKELARFATDDTSLRIHGYVEDVRDYISRSAVYVVPIRVGGGTRLKILDAFACGKALVSTSIGCEGIDVSPGNNILIGDSSGEFADQVIKLIKDETLRRKLEINARKLVEEKYSWEIIGRRLNEIYGNAVK